MSISTTQLLEYVIKPTLEYLELDSLSAQRLLLGTCAQESQMGTYLHQIGGPALGIYQMEPNTYHDIWDNYLKNKKNWELRNKISIYCRWPVYMDDLMWSLRYATTMCRIHYLRVPETLPKYDDIPGLAQYWKKYYNTELGKGRVEDFIKNYHRFGINKL